MSNKAKCPYCKRLIEKDATKFPWCHSDTSAWAEKNGKIGCLSLVGGGIFIFLLIIMIINSNDNESSSNKNSSTQSTSTQQVDNIITDKNEHSAEYDGFHSTNKENKQQEHDPNNTDNNEHSAEYDEIYSTNNEDKQQDNTETEMSELEQFYHLIADIRKTDFDKANKDKKGIIQKVASFKNTEDYESVILFVIENNKDLSKNWEKNGQYFSSQIEFYEAYTLGNYKEIIKARKM